jgi:hypothetical protein
MTFPPSSYGADSPQITYAQAEGYWLAAGGPAVVMAIMAAVAQAESGLRPARVQEGQPYQTTGWGLWQITPGDSVSQVGVDQELLDPLTNAKAAVIKYKVLGLRAWTTFADGSYTRFLERNIAPVLPFPPIGDEMAANFEVVKNDASGAIEAVFVQDANNHLGQYTPGPGGSWTYTDLTFFAKDGEGNPTPALTSA